MGIRTHDPSVREVEDFRALDHTTTVLGPGQVLAIKLISSAESEPRHGERLMVSVLGSGEGKERAEHKKHAKKQNKSQCLMH
jgi:hypothetical protein